LRMTRVRPVARGVSVDDKQRNSPARTCASLLTLVALLLDLHLLGQVLVLLPLDVPADRLVVHKVTAVADLFLRDISALIRSVLARHVHALGSSRSW
jgi:hypothetical protein